VLISERLAGLSAAAKLLVMSAVAGLIVGAIALPTVAVVGVMTKDGAATFTDLKVPNLAQLPRRSEILDSRGNVIAYYYPGGTAQNPGGIDRVPVSYNQIAPVMRNAIVAAEDSRFFQHGAIDPRGTTRALLSDLQGNSIQGGSTLAQQYVKNALVLTARTAQDREAATTDSLSRKIIELRIAANVEHQLTRQQLLAAYLNAAFFDNEAVGIQTASERYFSTTAAKLTLPEAAMLAGMVEFPDQYNPLVHPGNALNQRNVVLHRMQQVGYITAAQEQAAEAKPLGLHQHATALQAGCTAQSASDEPFFCDYVLSVMKNDPAYATVEKTLNTAGGLKIYTTLNPQDQHAAQHAVNFMVPAPPSQFNVAHNAAAEVLIQPGTGKIRAIAEDRPYGSGPGQTTVDYAVDTKYDGGIGVQTGSSSKLFTLLTALKAGMPFGTTMKIVSPDTISGYTDCHNRAILPYTLSNSEGATKKPEIFTLYNATTGSINIFFAHLEEQVGLCNVVKTAVSLGLHRADGQSLLAGVGKPGANGYQPPADSLASFTLGSVAVSPMSMAAAYATVAARGVYCTPIAIGKVIGASGASMPVPKPACRRALSTSVADAANYILQGVLTTGTGAGDGINRPAAGKTGTADEFRYAAFAGYTPHLVGYVSMFNPAGPNDHPMTGEAACFRAADGAPDCVGDVFGANAGQIWQETFLHAALGKVVDFVPVPPDSPFFSKGNGISSPKPPKPPKHGGGGGGGHHGPFPIPPNPSPSPSPSPGPGGGGGGGGGH
jgi:membrane peptidoglycan carboxypeptidase